MSFINRYSKHEKYFYSKEFTENNETFILAVGQGKGNGKEGLVCKIDLNGNQVWENHLVIEGVTEKLTLYKIIQILPPTSNPLNNTKGLGVQYVIHAKANFNNYILSINSSNGSVNWSKKINNSANEDINLFIEPKRQFGSVVNYAFYIALSKNNNEDGNYNPFIGRFDFYGNLIIGKNILFDKTNFKVNDLHAHEKGVGMACSYFENNHKTLIIDFDFEFQLDSHFIIQESIIVQNLKITPERRYYISGYLEKENKVFVCKVLQQTGGDFNIDLKIFPNTLEHNSKLQLSNNGVYLLHNSETHGIMHFLNSNIELQWTKELRFDKNENGINQFTFNKNTNSITSFAFNNSIKSSLVYTNELLDSCKTNVLNRTLTILNSSTKVVNVEEELANLTFINVIINKVAINSSKIEYCSSNTGIVYINEITALQSPNFYLQSTGSNGLDSSKGIHTRWVFSGALGEKHLPKGNNANNNGINFNKLEDFVKVYRTKYKKVGFTLDLNTQPTVVDDTNRLWIYQINEKEFYVYFRDATKYDELRTQIDPFIETILFIKGYNKLIEIESKNELFFALNFSGVDNIISSSSLQLESLSVSENTLNSPKIISFRNTYHSEEIDNVRVICENGRSIRYLPSNCIPHEFEFEFYADFIEGANNDNAWDFINKHALSTEDFTVLNNLEPVPNSVHGKWKRFNGENAYVNINNYIDKWNGNVEVEDKNIKQVVQSYITLSDNETNPTAIEFIDLDDIEGETLEVSNLNQLNIASYDFHVARMLGLGFLDLNPLVFNDSYVYIAEYITFGDLEDGLGARDVQHLSMSLPTSINDDRLPLPIDLKEIVPGLFIESEGTISNMTDEQGYTPDGRLRYITLFAEEIPENQIYPPFFNESIKFSAHAFTYPVYAGLEYRKVLNGNLDSGEWEEPEISSDLIYVNVDQNGNEIQNYFETLFIAIPEINQPFFKHKHRISGDHIYQSYSINWFSRATDSDIELTTNTEFNFNPLIPPSNINSVLIREESPLLLSSADEQERHRQLRLVSPPIDKTLIRLTFDYYSFHELVNYKVPLDSSITNEQILDVTNANNSNILFPDNLEIFADNIDIYFRNETPNNISGKITNITPDASENILSIITTSDYYIASADPDNDLPNASPLIISGTESNYIGGTLIIGEQQYIINEVYSGVGNLAVFKVYNKEISDGIISNIIPSADAESLQMPEITGDGFFMAVENMQNATSWGNPNPIVSFPVQVGQDWGIHREILGVPDGEGNIERQVEKTRGIWSKPNLGVNIEEVIEDVQQTDGSVIPQHNGMYKIIFNSLKLSHHPQNQLAYNQQKSVEWYKGIIRLFTQNSLIGSLPNKTRKNLNVIRIENIGEPIELVVYAFDSTFSNDANYDKIQIGNGLSANFYPGYKVYLYKDDTYGLNETNILPNPEGEEDVKYSIFGLQSVKNYTAPVEDKKSKISVPSLMFAQKMIQAERPEQPEGALYATRPDFFGRSTYTVTTKYQHKPHGVLFYRSNDEALLNALYSKNTVLEIKENLKHFGGNDEAYFNNRWQNFLNFEELILDGDFKEYPPQGVGEEHYKFPNPDKLAFFEWANVLITRINDNTAFPPDIQIQLFNVDVNHVDYANIPVGDPSIINFVKGAIFNAFVPLTQIPIIYQHIKPNSYSPINKKQVVRDRNGHVLHPSHEDFEMAPMMKVTSNVAPHETQFVDFNLDGTSNNIYFYGVRELSSQMKMGEFSPFLGPIKLVNTNPPESPEIKRIMPVLENPILGINPTIQLEINAYPEVQNIKKINIYRAFSKLDALSIRTMKLVKTVDIEDVGIISDAIWSVQDDFSDLIEIPYNEGLFYRITVAKKVEYAKANYSPDEDTTEIITDYAPSQASKIVATMMVEINNPPAPIPTYISEPINEQGELHQFMLSWNKTCYKGKYHVYKMNNQGNWFKIHELSSNDETMYLELVNTSIENHILQTKNEDGNSIYHHFKVVAENTSGMLSTEENIITAYNQDTWNDIGGIEDMIVGSTFLIR